MERACRLCNTTHWEITSSLSLPSLPPSCGARGQRLLLSEEPGGGCGGARSVDRVEILGHAHKIADLLRECDVSYLNLKEDEKIFGDRTECSWLYSEVVKYNSEAFEFVATGSFKEKHSIPERKPFEQNGFAFGQAQKVHGETSNNRLERNLASEPKTSASSRKPKVKKKELESAPSSTPEIPDHQGIVDDFCEIVDDFCGKAEIPSNQEAGADGDSLPLADIKMLVNEILPIREKRLLHLVPVDTTTRLLNVLDHQIRCGQGLSVDEAENPDADTVSLVLGALESTYAALAIMTHHDMPKQLYKEEIIERILDFSRHQIMEVMAASDPSYRALHKPSENGTFDGDENEEDEADVGSTGKKRRNTRSVKVKKPAGNKVSTAVYAVLQKLCSILGFLKDLLTVERLSDSCILQLARASFSTFLVDNIQVLQLKAIALICGVFGSYAQHRNFIIDETLQLLRKLPCVKRSLRTYLLPDEEQKQIQMISALLIQLVQYSANLPETLKSKLTYNSIHDISIDVDYPIKCHEAATEACCLFWTNVLQRLTTAKPQDTSESKMILENLVIDLLTTLNLPEYPASAPILEVLCVLLLQNAGLKSKDVSARCTAVDLLGTIAARLKRDAAVYRKERFWIVEQLVDRNNENTHETKDVCHACLEWRGTKTMIACHFCQRFFHVECLGVAGRELLFRDWSCHICLCKKQLTVLQSFCISNNKNDGKGSVGVGDSSSDASNSISRLEVVQQILLNYLQENASAADVHLFTRWFYLCLWYKDDPHCQEKITYYLARLKSKSILRDFGTSQILSRDWAKKISLALGQNNSFSRGFDKILSLLLASLRENSSILRAKALRAVSAVVEADPEVLGDKRVQCAVEGRFCDSAISVREAALELVGRHIASHPDVALKYFEKVAERIKDTGVSVRKRAIRIIRDMCISNAKFLESTHAFIEILSRVTDEESSIQDLVCKTFYEFWFEEPSVTQTQFVSDGSCVPLEVARKAEQIVNLLRKMPNNHLLVTVIKRNLALDFVSQSAKASGVNTVLIAQVRKRCELMCKHLLERILQLDETSTSEEEVITFPYVLALQAFCIVDPSLCAPATNPAQFVLTLQPYLKNQVDTRPVAQLLESIIFIIDAVMPLLRNLPSNVLKELEQDLKHMIVRHSFLTVVHACIKCLCSLCKIAGNVARSVEYLVDVFFKHLHGSSVDNKQLLGRSLFCLGLLVRYGKELLITSDVHIAKCLSFLKRFLLSEDFGMKVRSLQALGFVLIARPEFMLEESVIKILAAALSSGSDVRLKMQALQNINDYLLDEEAQMGIDSANNAVIQPPEDTGGKVPVAAGAGDTNICGGIIQLYWNNILELCLDVNEQVRQSALKIVEVVLRQGLVHPITCVPYLVALETDPQEANSKLAHHLLAYMNEKFPSFFENRLGDGLQMSFKFVQSILATTCGSTKGKSDASSFAFVKPGISRIYRLIRGSQPSRSKFMHSIVRKFEPGGWNCSSLPFLMYCTEILASLPFTCPDEPLYLIYDINRVVQLRAGPIESNMKMWSSLSHQKDLKEITNEDHELGQLTETYYISACNNAVAETVTSNDSYEVSKEILLKCQVDCRDAIALQLLLKLKRHLKIVFGLDDARCQAFSPKEYPKAGETLHRQHIPFNVSDTFIRLPSSFKDMIEKYQEFKSSLREDTVDYSTYTATVKKRPAQRVSRGKVTHVTNQDGEDEDSDEDWTGGPRKLNFSGQKAYGGRITRQRLSLRQ